MRYWFIKLTVSTTRPLVLAIFCALSSLISNPRKCGQINLLKTSNLQLWYIKKGKVETQQAHKHLHIPVCKEGFRLSSSLRRSHFVVELRTYVKHVTSLFGTQNITKEKTVQEEDPLPVLEEDPLPVLNVSKEPLHLQCIFINTQHGLHNIS